VVQVAQEVHLQLLDHQLLEAVAVEQVASLVEQQALVVLAVVAQVRQAAALQQQVLPIQVAAVAAGSAVLALKLAETAALEL
jgi:hypothetical protein